MITITISEHIRQDRLDRLTNIAMTIGIGNEVVKDMIIENKRYSLTDTGVMLVRSLDGGFLITAYIATIKQAKGMYNHCGDCHIPQNFFRKIKNNQKFIVECS